MTVSNLFSRIGCMFIFSLIFLVPLNAHASGKQLIPTVNQLRTAAVYGASDALDLADRHFSAYGGGATGCERVRSLARKMLSQKAAAPNQKFYLMVDYFYERGFREGLMLFLQVNC